MFYSIAEEGVGIKRGLCYHWHMARDIQLWIDEALCHTCRRCLAAQVCTVRAIRQIDRDEAPYLDVHRCFDCRKCLPACPFGAIKNGADRG